MNWFDRLCWFVRGDRGRAAARARAAGPRQIDCLEALEKLYEYLDGELEAPSCDEVRAHMDICQHCYPALAIEESFRDAVKRCRKGEAAPDHLRDQILRIIEREAADRTV